jgi:hypothetical protein
MKNIKNQIKLSIIIVNYNTKNLTMECVASIIRYNKDISYEIIVVDNASSDGSVEMVKGKFPKVKIIANKNNLGFVKANNQAITRAEGEYIFLLNPDTILLDKNLKQLIDFMNDHPEIGACGPLVLNKDGTMQRQCKRSFQYFWTTVTYYSGLWKLFPGSMWWKKKFGKYFLLDKPDDEICEVDQISGAAMIVRRGVLDNVGYMDEDYVMYWDETDWCFRIKKADWKVYYFPFVKIIHYGGSGGSRQHVFRNLWYFHRGACIFYRKHLASRYFFLINFLYYSGVWCGFIWKLFINFFLKEKIIGSRKPLKLSNIHDK